MLVMCLGMSTGRGLSPNDGRRDDAQDTLEPRSNKTGTEVETGEAGEEWKGKRSHWLHFHVKEREDVKWFHSRCAPSTPEIVLAAENTSCDWAILGQDKDMVKARGTE